ncbi:MAG: TauD/TfdA family dioxygenase [Vicinamibacterales bacterium]
MWEAEPLGSGAFGTRIVSKDRDSILDLDRDEVIGLFSAGAVQFRGFEVTPATFREFTLRFNRSVISHYPAGERRHMGGGTLTVSKDPARIPFHGEFHFLPNVNDELGPPELIWLYCVNPGVDGGETLLCDGVRVWPALSASTRALLTEHLLKYTLDTTAQTWRSALNVKTRQELDELLSTVPGVQSWRLSPAGTLRWVCVKSALARTRGGSDAFVNSMLCANPTLDDDTPIPKDVIDDVLDVTDRLTLAVDYQVNDVVMVDNWRCMHGRRNHDESRQIYFRMGMASF